MRRKLSGLLAIALVASVSAACSSSGGSSSGGSGNAASGSGGSAGSGTKGTVNVLVVADQSGANKTIGSQETLGVQAAAAYFNANGGVLGRKVSVKVLNDNADPTTATNLTVKELTQNPTKYSFVYAGDEGTIIAALIPIIKRQRVLAMAINDGQHLCLKASDCPTEFSMSGSPSLYTGSAADWFATKKYTNVGIINAQLDFTQNEVAPLKSQLAKHGIKSTSVGFPVSAVSVTSEMSQLKSAGAQGVFAAAFGAPIGYILGARAQLGWNVPVIFDVAGSSFNIPKLAPASQLKNTYETAFRCMDTSNKVPALDLIAKYAPTKPDGTVPCNQTASGWDSMMNFRAAAQKANSLKVDDTVKAMQSMTLSDPSTLANFAKYCWPASNHENSCNATTDWSTLPVGNIVNSRLAPL